MNISQVEEKVKALVGNIDQAEFLFNLLDCYGKPKASITRLKIAGKGSYNLSKQADEVLWKKQVYFKATESDQLLSVIDEMKHAESVTKHQPRFIIAINESHLLAIDTKTQDTLDVPIAELNKKFDFFLPWAGLEKAQAQSENPADVKAAEKMAKLFDLLRDNNAANTAQEIHAQNVFLSRILFCYFAEDTGIFEPKLFTNHIASHTAVDGTDLADYLSKVFDVMNLENRKGLPDYLTDFPYVNGGLFADKLPVPKFNRKSRAMLIECGADLNWSEINPDIFGSMIQAVVDPDERGNLGMHYTSMPNIMKVIEPLFLNELKEELEKHSDSKTKLEQLLLRLEHLKIFDPACGSGNFLIIAYKELRTLEMEVFKRLQELSKDGLIPLSRIKLSQFYGIEIDDFAHEVAILSLWLAEHQMNMKFKATFGHCEPALPLKSSGNVVCGNSALIDWNDVCKASPQHEVFILGNPPYLGARNQEQGQKDEVNHVLGHVDGVNSLDYISIWFYKGGQYVAQSGGHLGFLSTNSITQGEQVSMLWPHILEEMGVQISFAVTSFKWSNSAKAKAAVICVVIGLKKASNEKKLLFTGPFSKAVENISPYLTASKNVYVSKLGASISDLPEMVYGNQPIEGGFLILEKHEMEELAAGDRRTLEFIKPLTGGSEFLRGHSRWCIWIEDKDLARAQAIPAIKDRIAKVKKFREGGGQVASSLVDRPHQFRYRHRAKKSFFLVPCTSSERRDYMPVGFFTADHLTTHSAQIVYDADSFVFGVLSSRAHMLWVKAVGGRLKSDIRYSNLICYNTFPIPKISDVRKTKIREAGMKLLAVREAYPESTISNLYDPDDMPAELRLAHKELDAAIEVCYDKGEFKNDEDLLSHLFKLFEKMTEAQHA